MKKLFIVLAVASLGFVACNNSGEKKDGADTTATPTETPAATDTNHTAPADTTAKTDTVPAAPAK